MSLGDIYTSSSSSPPPPPPPPPSCSASIRFRVMASLCGARQSHSNTPHPGELLWTSDQLDAETSTWKHTTLTTNRSYSRRDSNPQSQQASGRTHTY
jgi:hypothetical protein